MLNRPNGKEMPIEEGAFEEGIFEEDFEFPTNGRSETNSSKALSIPARTIFTELAQGASLEQRGKIFAAFQDLKARMDTDSAYGLLRTLAPLVKNKAQLEELKNQFDLILEQKDTEMDALRRARELYFRHGVATILTPLVGLVDGSVEMLVIMTAEVFESLAFASTYIPRRIGQGRNRGTTASASNFGGFLDSE